MDKSTIIINGIKAKTFYLIPISGFHILNNLLIIRTYEYYDRQPNTTSKYELPIRDFKYAIGDMPGRCRSPIIWCGYYVHSYSDRILKKIYLTNDNMCVEENE